MTWRINTRASLQGSRHEDSGWIDQDSHISDHAADAARYFVAYEQSKPKRDRWTFAQLVCAVAALGCLAVAIALELSKWMT